MATLAAASRPVLLPTLAASRPVALTPQQMTSKAKRLACSPSQRSLFSQAKPRTVIVRREGQRINAPEPSTSEPRKGGKKDTVWQSWLNLSPSTRTMFGIALAVLAVGGLKLSDSLQQRMPAEGRNDAGGQARKARLLGISVVDRKDESK